MRRLLFVVFIVITMAALIAGCGGGGGGNDGDHNLSATFNVNVWDDGCGFSAAGQTNFVLLYSLGYDYQLELSRAIQSRDLVSNSHAAFSQYLGKPKCTNSDGAGVYEVRICQGRANQWTSSDYYDRWYVDGDEYCLGYGPSGSDYPGWTVWNLNTTKYVCQLSDYNMSLSIYLVSRDIRNGSTAKSAKSQTVLSEETRKANINSIATKVASK